MPFILTVTETCPLDSTPPDQVYQQTFQTLDLLGVIKAANTPPPAALKPKATRKDKGITRGPKPTPAATV